MTLVWPISLKRQRGSALMIAIFVIVVLAMLATGLLRMIDDSSRNTAWEVLGLRAELAAQSGLEQALASLFPLGQSAADNTACPVQSPPSVYGQVINRSFTASGAENCSVNVLCRPVTPTPLDDAHVISRIGSARFFDLEATGSCGSGEIEVQRIVAIQARSGT